MTSRELCSIYVSVGTGFQIDAYKNDICWILATYMDIFVTNIAILSTLLLIRLKILSVETAHWYILKESPRHSSSWSNRFTKWLADISLGHRTII